jgi:Tol biopolymer transport system component
VPIPTVNGASNDGDPVLSADGCELYFASDRNGGKYHLFHAEIAK